MIENYLKILNLNGLKNNPSKITDMMVLKNYKELVGQLDKVKEKAKTQEEINEIMEIENLLIEAYKKLYSEERREEYFKELRLEQVQIKNVVEKGQEEFNKKIYTEEDFKRIITFARDQTKTIEEQHQIQYVPIAKGSFGKTITKQKTVEEKPKIKRDDRERA